jgi:prepilin-type N-terminal cleavage/methylation domain-containing protein
MRVKKGKTGIPVKRRAGFGLIEVLVSSFILTIAIATSFSVIAYALMMTMNTRERMDTYALAERAGFLSISERKADVSSQIPDVITRSEVLATTTSPRISKDGASDFHVFPMQMVTHKRDPETMSTRVTKIPAAVVFLAQP